MLGGAVVGAPTSLLGFSVHFALTDKDDGGGNCRISHAYQPQHDGRSVTYSKLFRETQALFSGKRKLFANTRTAWNGEGVLFADTIALLQGKRKLFANTRMALFGAGEKPSDHEIALSPSYSDSTLSSSDSAQ